MATTTRKTAQIRREEILDAACAEFAQTGLHGTSTDAIARRAGVSQPYLFRLFGTKRELFIATVQRCFAETAQTFEHAALGTTGEDALKAMAGAYHGLLADRRRLQAQMQAYAACDEGRVRDFFAAGMLLNVMAQMDLLDCSEPWAKRLIESCLEWPHA